jgi:pimeloyl-ACP methyl ester carboxylesterase
LPRTGCAAAFPGLPEEYARLVERLEAQPAVVDLDPRNRRDFGPVELGGAVRALLLSPAGAARLPRLVHAAYAQGAYSPLARMLPADLPEQAALLNWVVRCNEPSAQLSPRRSARLSRGTSLEAWADYKARFWAEVCRGAPVAALPPDAGEAVRSDVPALILVGEADPQDPPEHARALQDGLADSLLVSVPGGAHTVGTLGCLPELTAAFIEAGASGNLDASCAAQAPVLPFEGRE